MREALESVSRQTWLAKNPDSLEILLVIDGECDGYESQIPSELKPILKILKIPHCGVSGARNHAIEKAASDKYIAFLDADDVWIPQKLEQQVTWMDTHPDCGMVYTNSFWIDKSGRVLSRTQSDQYGYLPDGDIKKPMLERDYIITSSVLLRKNVFAKAGMFRTDLEVCEDWEFKIRVAKSFRVHSILEPLIYYRLHAEGTHYKCARMLECGYMVFEEHLQTELAGFSNGQMQSFKANIPLNLAGSLLYIDRPKDARKYLAESYRLNPRNKRLYLMFGLTLLPTWARDILLYIRDKFKFLP